MEALVVGATGATGRLLVDQLLQRNVRVRVIVRSSERLPEPLRTHARVSITEAGVLDLSDAELADHVKGCDGVASCLGHNLSLKGIYGRPRRLVTQATSRLSAAIASTAPAKPVRYVLMNTTGNRNLDLEERRTALEHLVIGLLRTLLPPQPDNEQAAEHLRVVVGQHHPSIEWAAVRPDGLTNEDAVTDYELHRSPVRSPIFNAGKTSRINVAHFMARLMTEDDVWSAWKGQMPVIYNKPHG